MLLIISWEATVFEASDHQIWAYHDLCDDFFNCVCVDHFAKEHSPVQWLSCRFETQKDFCKTCAHVTLHALNYNKFIRRSCKIIQVGMQSFSFSSRVRGTPGCNSNLEHSFWYTMYNIQYILSYIHYTQCITRDMYIMFALHDIASYPSLGQRQRSSWLQRNLPLRPRLRRHWPKRAHLPNM